jgi:high-affinity Fe2+/Pb2+ permease
MNPFALSAVGLILASVGVFMYRSPRAVELIRRDALGRSQLWRELVYLAVLGAVPEGLGLILSGLLAAVGQETLALFVFIAANLVVLGLWLTRPAWTKPYWLRDKRGSS